MSQEPKRTKFFQGLFTNISEEHWNKSLIVVSLIGEYQIGKTSFLQKISHLSNKEAIGNGHEECTSKVTYYGPYSLNTLLQNYGLHPNENDSYVLFLDTPGLLGFNFGSCDVNVMTLVHEIGPFVAISDLVLLFHRKPLNILAADAFASFFSTIKEVNNQSTYQKYTIFEIFTHMDSYDWDHFSVILQEIKQIEEKHQSPIINIDIQKSLPFPLFDRHGYIWEQSSDFDKKAESIFKEILQFLIQKSLEPIHYTIHDFQRILQQSQESIEGLGLIQMINLAQEIQAHNCIQETIRVQTTSILNNEIRRLNDLYNNEIQKHLFIFRGEKPEPIIGNLQNSLLMDLQFDDGFNQIIHQYLPRANETIEQTITNIITNLNTALIERQQNKLLKKVNKRKKKIIQMAINEIQRRYKDHRREHHNMEEFINEFPTIIINAENQLEQSEQSILPHDSLPTLQELAHNTILESHQEIRTEILNAEEEIKELILEHLISDFLLKSDEIHNQYCSSETSTQNCENIDLFINQITNEFQLLLENHHFSEFQKQKAILALSSRLNNNRSIIEERIEEKKSLIIERQDLYKQIKDLKNEASMYQFFWLSELH